MNPQIKTLWLEALRSGRYKQGKGRLVGLFDDDKKYCCLGVLCELAVKEGVCVQVPNENCFSFDNMRAVLPDSVQLWAGLTDENPHIAGSALSNYNDGEAGFCEHSFKEIADLIEKHL